MARAARHSRILSAAKYYSAIDNYIKYITDSSKRGSRVGQGKPKPKSIKLYIDPFAIPMATGQVVRQSASEPAWTTYGTFVGNRADATAPTNNALIIPVANYAAPRVSVTRGRRATGTKKTSAVTGMPYLDYGGESSSVPFGSNGTADDTMQGAYDDIATRIRVGVPGVLTTLIRERI